MKIISWNINGYRSAEKLGYLTSLLQEKQPDIICLQEIKMNEPFPNHYGYHDYYHFMVGVEFPLKSQEYIHSFFEENRGYEFIGYDVVNFSDRMKYWNIWGKYARSQKKYQKMLFKWNSNILHIQEILGINRIKGKENYYKKGYAQWSITHELANFILDEFKKIKGQYYFTYCADEIFFQTIVFHSKYYDRVFDPNNEYK